MSKQTTTTAELANPDHEYRFLSGADMEPAAIRATYPGARFVARAYLSDTPSSIPGDATWGIVIRLATLPPAPNAGPSHQATTDDGRVLTVTLAPGTPADAAATLTAAKYWELPPAYVARLARS